ncbi:MAG TPA: hypothetical protein VK914_10175 [bacterium]|jgi:hypothetical protein|nr:hypothetical protein [bacterium]
MTTRLGTVLLGSVLLVLPLFCHAWKSPYGHWPPVLGDSAILFQQVSPNGKWRLVCADYWTQGGDSNFKYAVQSVVCSVFQASDKIVPIKVAQNQAEAMLVDMEINNAVWSADSQYCLFSARHSGGHSPWNDPAYVVDLKTLKLYPVEDVTGPIVGKKVTMDQNDFITVFVGATDQQGDIHFDNPLTKTVSIEQVLKVKPMGKKPRWTKLVQ